MPELTQPTVLPGICRLSGLVSPSGVSQVLPLVLRAQTSQEDGGPPRALSKGRPIKMALVRADRVKFLTLFLSPSDQLAAITTPCPHPCLLPPARVIMLHSRKSQCDVLEVGLQAGKEAQGLVGAQVPVAEEEGPVPPRSVL